MIKFAAQIRKPVQQNCLDCSKNFKAQFQLKELRWQISQAQSARGPDYLIIYSYLLFC